MMCVTCLPRRSLFGEGGKLGKENAREQLTIPFFE